MPELTRRSLLRGAAAVAPVLAALAAPATAARAEEAATPAPAGTLIMVIRHAEKPTGSGTPYGITAGGEHDNRSLTVRGWTRAGALVELFDPVTTKGKGSLRSGLQRPQRLYAANPSHASARPSETLTPLASRLSLHLHTDYKSTEEKKLAEEVRSLSGATLIAWEHEKIPTLVRHLGTVTPVPPSSWPSHRFDMVWCFARHGSGWAFSQVPQLLLAGDSTTPL